MHSYTNTQLIKVEATKIIAPLKHNSFISTTICQVAEATDPELSPHSPELDQRPRKTSEKSEENKVNSKKVRKKRRV